MIFFTLLESKGRQIGIRKLKESDAEGVACLYEENFPEHVFIEALREPETWRKKADLTSRGEEVWVVAQDTLNNNIVGCAGLVPIPLNNSAEIERVVVAKDYRGIGISKEMIRTLENEAEEKGVTYFFAWVRGAQPAMQKTFLNLGYRVFGIGVPFFVVMYEDSKTPRRSINNEARPMREIFVLMYKSKSNDLPIPTTFNIPVEVAISWIDSTQEILNLIALNKEFGREVGGIQEHLNRSIQCLEELKRQMYTIRDIKYQPLDRELS